MGHLVRRLFLILLAIPTVPNNARPIQAAAGVGTAAVIDRSQTDHVPSPGTSSDEMANSSPEPAVGSRMPKPRLSCQWLA